MRYLIVIALLLVAVSCGGCEYIVPDISKAISEKEQVRLNERQVVALEKIAFALEKR